MIRQEDEHVSRHSSSVETTAAKAAKPAKPTLRKSSSSRHKARDRHAAKKHGFTFNKHEDSQLLSPEQLKNYGEVAPARSKKIRHRRKGRVAFVVCALFVVLTVVAVYYGPQFFAETTVLRLPEGERPVLTDERIEGNLNNLGMTRPDLSGFAYVNNASLIGPRFENIQVKDVEGDDALGISKAYADEAGASADTIKNLADNILSLFKEHEATGSSEVMTRIVQADATYRNDSVNIVVPIVLPYSYDPEAETWRQGDVETGSPQVTPISGPSATAIVSGLPDMLAQQDANVAAQFQDCTWKITSDLTTSGGTINVDLMKLDNMKVRTCSVAMNVTWSDQEGWIPSIQSVGQVKESDEDLDMAMTCDDGALVKFVGTIEGDDDDLVLKLDEPFRLTIGSDSWNVDRIPLSIPDADASASLKNKHATVVGNLWKNLAKDNLPAGLAVTSADVDGAKTDFTTPE